MVRKIESRLKISGILITESPLHVGGNGGDSLVDLALAINGRGEYYISGTSLAGAFKNWMQDCFKEDQQLTKNLWGFSEKAKGEDSNRGHASFILVEDTVIKLPEGAKIEIRDGVGIDRQWGAAADQIKYDRAIIPRGASFKLDLTVEIPKDNDKSDQIKSDNFILAMGTLLATLNTGEIKLGAAKTRGLGKIKLAPGYTVTQHNLLTSDGIMTFLRGEPGKNCQPQNKPSTIPQLTITIKWKPVGALMVKTEQDGIAVDILPLVSSVNQNLAFVLPGSSIKGALRTQAERIIRTVCRIDMTKEQEGIKRFNQQLQGIPLVENIFGAAAKKQEIFMNGKPKLGLGALSIDDCYAENVRMNHDSWSEITSAPKMTNDDWRALASLPQEEQKTHLCKALEQAKLTTTQQAYHVAVDRWTGGAADGFLYSNLEPFGIEWEDICLTLNFNRIPENEQNVAIALLLITLRDFNAGRIPLGYGVNRGMGAIKVENISLEAKNLPRPFDLFNHRNTEISFSPEGQFQQFDSSLLAELETSWRAWIECNNHQKDK
jgi:CRISPR/Cas system CSM-associated protein Csm3 (group 7 of RAMP superfamily)